VYVLLENVLVTGGKNEAEQYYCLTVPEANLSCRLEQIF
jgi:hypothetical protein